MTAKITVRTGSRLEMKLFPVPRSAGLARRFVAHHLAALGHPEMVDDACQITSELVTNALAETPAMPIWVLLGPDAAGRLLLEVRDCSPNPPVARNADAYAESGRGLLITRALSAQCGYRLVGADVRGPAGKVVWAALK
jgi:hypothetical protein